MKNRSASRMSRADEIRRQASSVFLMAISLGLISAICIASSASAQNRYRITRIPAGQGANSSALGVNNKGEVVGYSFLGDDYQAFLYSTSDHSLTEVGSLGGKINAACAINDAGQVTGYSQDGNGNLLGFVFSRNQQMTSLGTLAGASSSEAFGINNNGEVVGDSQSGAQTHRPVLFSNGSAQDLGLGGSSEPEALETAFAINDVGQIVGRHRAGNNAFHAFVFANGNTTDLRTLGGPNGEALGINKNGVVVGDSDTADGILHAFVFDHSELKDLGTLPGLEKASYARGINNSGEIVGESESADQKRAFLYTKGRLVELDKLAENLSEAGFNSLDVAYAINDKGWIVGYGITSDNLTSAFVAVPEGRGTQGQADGVPQPQVQRPMAPPEPQSQVRGEEQHVSDSNEEDYDVFYNGLSSGEGDWVEAGDYGYCFRPRVSGDWRPYRDGHWVWTDHGWYWNSNERFGWATYHYGRWANIDGTGWCWVPGTQWAPAWVSWRESNDNVGWAPLPPEADISVHQSISSWSDSYYNIGPAAYAFISYSRWREPSYSRFIERPERNVQLIRQTRNVTNIVSSGNGINSFGPPVQSVERRTNHQIREVKLAFNRATDPRANFGQTRQGTQLNVIAPPATLKPQARHTPLVQSRIENPQVERGWQGVKPQDAERFKKIVAEQNPPPKDLPKPAPFVNRQIGNQGPVTGSPGVTASPGATGSPPGAAGPHTPPNLVRPGKAPPNANVTPGAAPNAEVGGRKSVPPNLLGAKSFATPGASPTVKPSGMPGGSRTTPFGKPPNLNVPRPSATPGQPGPQAIQPVVTPTPKPAAILQPGQNLPHPSPTLRAPGATPAQEKKPEMTPPPISHGGPANLPSPKPASTPRPEPANVMPPVPGIKSDQREISTPQPAPVSTPRREPPATPKPAPEVKVTPPPQQEIKATPPQVHPTPAPQPRVLPTAPIQPQAQKTQAPKQEIRTPAPEVRHTPAPQPRVVRTLPAQPQAQKTQAPKQEIRTPAPQVRHAPAPQPRVVHTPPAQQQTPKAQPPKQEIKAPAPQVHHAPAPQPRAVHPPPVQPPAQKAQPPKQAQRPQGGQKHEPAKGKPTPKP
jgi:probable HAF family extracellular repeat protein